MFVLSTAAQILHKCSQFNTVFFCFIWIWTVLDTKTLVGTISPLSLQQYIWCELSLSAWTYNSPPVQPRGSLPLPHLGCRLLGISTSHVEQFNFSFHSLPPSERCCHEIVAKETLILAGMLNVLCSRHPNGTSSLLLSGISMTIINAVFWKLHELSRQCQLFHIIHPSLPLSIPASAFLNPPLALAAFCTTLLPTLHSVFMLRHTIFSSIVSVLQVSLFNHGFPSIKTEWTHVYVCPISCTIIFNLSNGCRSNNLR